jgi:hypothetical protein
MTATSNPQTAGIGPGQTPGSVTSLQIRLALTALALRTQFENGIAASANQGLKDWWAYSNLFNRNDPQMAVALTAAALSSVDGDNIFGSAMNF